MVIGDSVAIDWILMGRSLDLIRIMRFFQIFRDVVRRVSIADLCRATIFLTFWF